MYCVVKRLSSKSPTLKALRPVLSMYAGPIPLRVEPILLSPFESSDALSSARCVGTIILVRAEINKFLRTSIPNAATASHSLFKVTGSSTTPPPIILILFW